MFPVRYQQIQVSALHLHVPISLSHGDLVHVTLDTTLLQSRLACAAILWKTRTVQSRGQSVAG